MKTTEPTRTDNPNQATAQQCTNCGMERSEWRDAKGYTDSEGDTYCCRGCATGEGCTCV